MFAEVIEKCPKCGADSKLASLVVIARGRLKCRAFYDCGGSCRRGSFMKLITDEDAQRLFYDAMTLRLDPDATEDD